MSLNNQTLWSAAARDIFIDQMRQNATYTRDYWLRENVTGAEVPPSAQRLMAEAGRVGSTGVQSGLAGGGVNWKGWAMIAAAGFAIYWLAKRGGRKTVGQVIS